VVQHAETRSDPSVVFKLRLAKRYRIKSEIKDESQRSRSPSSKGGSWQRRSSGPSLGRRLPKALREEAAPVDPIDAGLKERLNAGGAHIAVVRNAATMACPDQIF